MDGQRRWTRGLIESGRLHLRRLYSRWFVLGAHWLEFLETASSICGPDTIVLDAGSGEGPHEKRFSARKLYIAIDLNPDNKGASPGRLSVVGDLSTLPFRDGAIDVILSTQVLEHTREPKQVIAEFARVLRPGGHVFMTVPLIWPEHMQPIDFFRYTKFGLQHLLDLAALEKVEITPMGGFFSVCRLMWNELWDPPQVPAAMRYVFRVMRPVFWLLQAFGRWVLAPICHFLDGLNPDPSYTIGYFCSARKSPVPKPCVIRTVDSFPR